MGISHFFASLGACGSNWALVDVFFIHLYEPTVEHKKASK